MQFSKDLEDAFLKDNWEDESEETKEVHFSCSNTTLTTSTTTTTATILTAVTYSSTDSTVSVDKTVTVTVIHDYAGSGRSLVASSHEEAHQKVSRVDSPGDGKNDKSFIQTDTVDIDVDLSNRNGRDSLSRNPQASPKTSLWDELEHSSEDEGTWELI